MDSKIKVFSPEGFEIEAVFVVDTPQALRQGIIELVQAGFLPRPPDPSAPGEHSAVITVAVRRDYAREGKRKRAVDLYAARGKYRFITVYLDDDPAAIAAFENASGLKLANMPVYASQTSIERDMNYPHDCEVKVPTPFLALSEPYKEKEINGKTQMTYRFAGYRPAPAAGIPPAQSVPPAQSAPVSNGHTNGNGQQQNNGQQNTITTLDDLTIRENAAAFCKRWNSMGVDNNAILQALKVSKISEWKQGVPAADKAVGQWRTLNLIPF